MLVEILIVSKKSFLKRHSDRKDPPRIVPRMANDLFAINVAFLIIQNYKYFLDNKTIYFFCLKYFIKMILFYITRFRLFHYTTMIYKIFNISIFYIIVIHLSILKI